MLSSKLLNSAGKDASDGTAPRMTSSTASSSFSSTSNSLPCFLPLSLPEREHLPEWSIQRTTKADKLLAKNIAKELKTSGSGKWDEAKDFALFRLEYRRLIGFSLPVECVFLIKSFLLHHPDIFRVKDDFFKNSVPYIPSWLLLTMKDEITGFIPPKPKEGVVLTRKEVIAEVVLHTDALTHDEILEAYPRYNADLVEHHMALDLMSRIEDLADEMGEDQDKVFKSYCIELINQAYTQIEDPDYDQILGDEEVEDEDEDLEYHPLVKKHRSTFTNIIRTFDKTERSAVCLFQQTNHLRWKYRWVDMYLVENRVNEADDDELAPVPTPPEEEPVPTPPEDDLNDLMWFFDGDHDDEDVDEGDDLIELAPVVVSRSQLIFDEQGRFICPSEIFNLIKSYLLLPRRNYEAKLDWWNYHHDLPYVTLRKAVFDYHEYNQIIHQTPIRLLPDTQSKAFRQLHSILDAKPLEEEAFCDYPRRRICGSDNCENEDGLVVRTMEYSFHELIGVPLMMEQLICSDCLDEYDYCGMCFGQVQVRDTEYRECNRDVYNYTSHYFCEGCVDDVNGIGYKRETKACGHWWECGCDKNKCNKCVKTKKRRCDDETCKVYYYNRNDRCKCGKGSCRYCEELYRRTLGWRC
jgi:hypothetical protein